MNKFNKSIVTVFSLFLILSMTASAARLPTVGESNWGSVLDSFLLQQHNADGTLKNASVTAQMINLSTLPVSSFANDAGYLTVEQNPTNASLQITTSQVTGLGAFASANFVSEYDSRAADRFGNSNFSNMFPGTFDTRLALKTTSDLTEGSNLYFTNSRFDTRFGTKTTSDLAEGTNLYFTNARAVSALNSAYAYLAVFDGSYSSLTGEPTALSAFTNDVGFLTVESNPTNATLQITPAQVTGLAAFVVANEVNPTNATIRIPASQVTGLATVATSGSYNDLLNLPTDINPTNDTIQINPSQVTGLAAFVVANEKNPTNASLQITTSQVTGLVAFVVANEQNPTNSTIQIATSQVTGFNAAAVSAVDAAYPDLDTDDTNDFSIAAQNDNVNHVVCWKTATTLSHCTDAPAGDGSCTCA